MRWRNAFPPLIAFALLVCLACGDVVEPRWSCYHHQLAGGIVDASAVLPVGANANAIASNVHCRVDDDGTVITEIHSALENGAYQVMSKKSVNFQIVDLYHLRDIVRRSHCSQKVEVTWKNRPELGKGAITLVSLLNESQRVEYQEFEDRRNFVLVELAAGVRHLIPDDDDYDGNPTVTASMITCKHLPSPQCRVRGRVDVELEANLEWSYTFAFRTDTTNQTLVTLRSGEIATTVRLENDYFIRADNAPPIPIGHLSNAQWHTVVVKHSEPDRHLIKIDNSEAFELPRTIPDDDSSVTLTIGVSGEIQLIDPSDADDDCLVTFGQNRRKLQETVSTHPLCSGCGCSMLTEQFDGLSRCATNDDGAYSFRRDVDRLAFLYSDNAFDVDTNGAVIPALSATFKSDSDAGLVFFGFWENAAAKGRLQVFYQSDTLNAVYCTQRDDEECVGCTIRRASGFATDRWIQTTLWGGGDGMHLAVDEAVCRLTPTTNTSLAEVYAIPQTAHGSGLFIGGTYHEKKRRGLYRSDVEHNFFENTREKAPVLRGCVKDVFVRGIKQDLNVMFARQKKLMLTDVDDADAFAIQPFCPICQPSCEAGTRCRAYTARLTSPMVCDCSDALRYNTSVAFCERKRDATPLVLSTAFVRDTQLVLDTPNTKALLGKVWMKFTVPKRVTRPHVVAEFNSHRDKLFTLTLDAKAILHVHVHGHETSSHQLDVADNRVHLMRLTRRTPIGTRHNARKYDLQIDGWRTVVSDVGRMALNNVSVSAIDTPDESSSFIIHDFGLSYEYDEHFAVNHPTNVIHQIDLHSQLLPYQFRDPDLTRTGILDDSLWATPVSAGVVASPHGEIVDYTTDVIEPEQLLSSRWLIYSMFLSILLCLLILVFIICYCCVIRRRSLRHSGSQRTIMRDSPDYGPVKLRNGDLGDLSDEDASIGTDDTDLQAYRDIPSHRVKIYRESMVSILVPSIDQPAEAAIVKRPSIGSQKHSDAPLVAVNDD
ncbi:unnamed protein product [Caenorhabditis bovis]|uniref:BAM-2-like concanavalin A-like domain-containing protein n=1 Tax=Caenorhabditis bovis TaxID=2654633 RepID=A0A8S1F3P1_9PELO|nr:unnamed protein product [Caenorhabditis bovis]